MPAMQAWMNRIYGLTSAADPSPLGGMLYGYEFDSPCFQSVRTRRAVSPAKSAAS